ncbi:YihY/virulence factor BrkB family protein [Phenylobacterium terrae]|uniref:YihY/virulence factor BrkB family protein n=1 Tax=Phenylobacterium terrae TaxID=2665495 RepID=A0ABW4N600_9CAUL
MAAIARSGLKPTSPLVVAPWLALGLMLAAWPRRKPKPRGMSQPEDAPLEANRGRTAVAPSRIPFQGWKDILWRTWREFMRDRVTFVAGGIAFTGVMALFPALAAFVALYGLFSDVETAREHLAILTGLVPASVLTFIGEQMVRIAEERQASLSITFAVSLLISLWSANAGMKALFNGLNVAYEETEKRNFFQVNLIALFFTVGGTLFFVVAATAVVAVPVALKLLHIDPRLLPLALLRWPLLLAVTFAALTFVYRYGPSRERAKWRWVTWGGIAASCLWLAGSAGFSWWVTNVASLNATYGSLGAVFGFLIWIWLSAVIVLTGAELNAEIEHQTAVDSTTGPEEPMGQRGAVVADTVGRAKTGGPAEMLPDFVARRLRRGRTAPDQALAAE